MCVCAASVAITARQPLRALPPSVLSASVSAAGTIRRRRFQGDPVIAVKFVFLDGQAIRAGVPIVAGIRPGLHAAVVFHETLLDRLLRVFRAANPSSPCSRRQSHRRRWPRRPPHTGRLFPSTERNGGRTAALRRRCARADPSRLLVTASLIPWPGKYPPCRRPAPGDWPAVSLSTCRLFPCAPRSSAALQLMR